MFERFTDQARALIVETQVFARSIHHNYIGTEHLLYAFANPDNEFVTELLLPHGLTQERIEAGLLEQVRAGEQPLMGHLPFTPRAKKVLELGLRAALHNHVNYIGPEHLWHGFLQEGGGVGIDVAIHLYAVHHEFTVGSREADSCNILEALKQEANAYLESRSGRKIDKRREAAQQHVEHRTLISELPIKEIYRPLIRVSDVKAFVEWFERTQLKSDDTVVEAATHPLFPLYMSLVNLNPPA